ATHPQEKLRSCGGHHERREHQKCGRRAPSHDPIGLLRKVEFDTLDAAPLQSWLVGRLRCSPESGTPSPVILAPSPCTTSRSTHPALILLVSIFSSTVLILMPLVAFQRQGLRRQGKWGFITFFLAIGLGYIFIEISFVQKF